VISAGVRVKIVVEGPLDSVRENRLKSSRTAGVAASTIPTRRATLELNFVGAQEEKMKCPHWILFVSDTLITGTEANQIGRQR